MVCFKLGVLFVLDGRRITVLVVSFAFALLEIRVKGELGR